MAEIVPIRFNLDFNQVKKIALELYGLNVSNIKQLNGYDDKNYYVSNESGEFLLKIVNVEDSKNEDIFKAQSLLLIHLENHGIICPKPILTKNGKFFEKWKLDSGEHIVRLLNYIDGVTLDKVTPNNQLFYQVGQLAANLDNSLKTFSHRCYENYSYLWQLHSVPEVEKMLYVITDETKYNLVSTIIKKFSTDVLPLEGVLEKGLIHGDLNEQNIIVEEQNGVNGIKAVIDFGDCHFGCYLYELAITMIYMIIVANDLEVGGHVLAGYQSVRKVTDLEYSLLKLCISARLCQSLVIGAFTNYQDPQNTYVLTTAKTGWSMLTKIWNIPDKELLEIWKRALDLEI